MLVLISVLLVIIAVELLGIILIQMHQKSIFKEFYERVWNHLFYKDEVVNAANLEQVVSKKIDLQKYE